MRFIVRLWILLLVGVMAAVGVVVGTMNGSAAGELTAVVVLTVRMQHITRCRQRNLQQSDADAEERSGSGT